MLHFCQGPFTQGFLTTITVCPIPCLLHCHMEKKMYKCGRDIIYGILTSLCIEGFFFRLNYGAIYYYFFKPKCLTLANAMPYDCKMTNCKYHTMFLLMLDIHYFKISNIKVRIYWELNLTTRVSNIIQYAMETCEIFCYLLHHAITVAWLIYRKMV